MQEIINKLLELTKRKEIRWSKNPEPFGIDEDNFNRNQYFMINERLPFQIILNETTINSNLHLLVNNELISGNDYNLRPLLDEIKDTSTFEKLKNWLDNYDNLVSEEVIDAFEKKEIQWKLPDD